LVCSLYAMTPTSDGSPPHPGRFPFALGCFAWVAYDITFLFSFLDDFFGWLISGFFISIHTVVFLLQALFFSFFGLQSSRRRVLLSKGVWPSGSPGAVSPPRVIFRQRVFRYSLSCTPASVFCHQLGSSSDSPFWTLWLAGSFSSFLFRTPPWLCSRTVIVFLLRSTQCPSLFCVGAICCIFLLSFIGRCWVPIFLVKAFHR